MVTRFRLVCGRDVGALSKMKPQRGETSIVLASLVAALKGLYQIFYRLPTADRRGLQNLRRSAVLERGQCLCVWPSLTVGLLTQRFI
jgi:hypothetical protein